MKTVITQSHEEASVLIADMVSNIIQANKNACLGLATGESMELIYAALVKLFNGGKVSFSSVTTVNLDEYVGLPLSHPQSYREYMNRNFFDHTDIDRANTYVPMGMEPEDQAHRDFQTFLEAHPRDFQLLGVGTNGHIGFNEPGRFFESNSHIVTLNDQTRRDNSRFFSSLDEVPKYAVTMGMGDIMKASRIVMLVHGANKVKAVRELFTHRQVVPEVPCTILKLHRDATVVLTEELVELAELKRQGSFAKSVGSLQ
ncbi:MAG: glucosamine-6-phosphate deaminase [Synergistaceae bacterium]|jgi:glucosamine-6-phosphate deaminase|nr:glucosamine-6-phosphate deaminase [Synergistaceae bacterium]